MTKACVCVLVNVYQLKEVLVVWVCWWAVKRTLLLSHKDLSRKSHFRNQEENGVSV